MDSTGASEEYLYMSIKERISKMKGIVKKEIFNYRKKDYPAEKNAYEKILNIIKSSEPVEVDQMEILLKCDLGTYKRLDDFKNIMPLFVSLLSVIITTEGIFFENFNFNEAPLDIYDMFYDSLLLVCNISILVILIFFGIHTWCDSKTRKIEYLLGIIEKYRNQ